MTQEAFTAAQPKEPKLVRSELDRATLDLIIKIKNTLKSIPEFTQALTEQFLEADDPPGLSPVHFQKGNFLYKVICGKHVGANVPGYKIEVAKYSPEE